MAERRQGPRVRRHCVVRKETRHNLPQPATLVGDRLMHPLSQFFLHSLERAPHAVVPRLPAYPETPTA